MKVVHIFGILFEILLIIEFIFITVSMIINYNSKKYRYDVNRDGQVNVVDMVVIEKYIRGE